MTNEAFELKDHIASMPLFSTHEHHKEDAFHSTLNLDILIANSYVGWCSLPKNKSKDERSAWLQKVKYNSYYIWLEKALMRIYNVGPLSADNWEEISDRIQNAHRNPDHHMTLLRESAGYVRFLEDCYWLPGSDIGHPEIATAVYRIDPWMSAYTPDIVENNIVHSPLGRGLRSLDAFEEALIGEIKMRRSSIAALKCAVAYERSIDFQTVERSEILSIYGKNPALLSEGEKKKFGDYVFSLVLEISGQLDLPVQIHTGLAKLSGSNPMLLEPVIAAHPKTTFVLFHGGFPWIYETAGLAHNYSNVILDINWLPLISTSAAVQALHVYMEVLPSAKRITWGGDCWTSEEAVGAAMAFRYVLERVLAEKIEEGFIDVQEAISFAEHIMYKNAQEIYGIR